MCVTYSGPHKFAPYALCVISRTSRLTLTKTGRGVESKLPQGRIANQRGLAANDLQDRYAGILIIPNEQLLPADRTLAPFVLAATECQARRGLGVALDDHQLPNAHVISG